MSKKVFGFILAVAAIIVVGVAFSNRSANTTITELTTPGALPTPTVELKNGDTYDLTASSVTKEIAGKKVRMLAYNGSIPGPTIKVRQGDQVTIRFTNKTDMKTLLHAHGVRMDNAFDGSQLVQKEMEPGETFSYVLKFPDAGVYWYHPHVRDDMEQAMGLYGNFIVAPSGADEWNPVDHDATLALGDILLEDGDIAPYSREFVTHALMGRFGNTMLVNGKTEEEFHAEPGEVWRFYVTNVASTRTMRFGIVGLKLKLVGADDGRFEHETLVDDVIVSPSERVIVEVQFPSAGNYTLEHRTPNKNYALGTVMVSGAAVSSDAGAKFATLRDASLATKAEFAAARAFMDKAPDKTLRFTLRSDMNAIMSSMMQGGSGMGGDGHGHMHGSMGMSGMNMGMMGGTVTPIEWEDAMGAMNVYATDKTVTWIMRDETTGKENMAIDDWIFPRGSMVKVRLVNDPTSVHPMQHPFHAHGNRFVVLATDGKPNANMAWKDTVLVPAGSAVDILIDMSNPGKWMAHCHILEHLHSGMMIPYTVE